MSPFFSDWKTRGAVHSAQYGLTGQIQEDFLLVQFQNIPEPLKDSRFCCWKRVIRDGRPTKMPINPLTGRAASTNAPETFGSLDQAKAAYERGGYDGVGILVGGSIAAFDIDHCIQEDGTMNALASDVLAAFSDCYVETSPSGTGLRGFFTVRQDFSYDRAKYYIKHGDLEIYLPGVTNRFVTVTGNVLEERKGAALAESTNALIAVLDRYMVRPVSESPAVEASPHSILTDDQVLAKAMTSQRFADCYHGHWSSYFPSQSEADLSVMNTLAFYCGGDMEQMDRIFSGSGLMREKYANRRTGYAERTLRTAVEGQTSFYDPEHGRTCAADDFDRVQQEATGAANDGAANDGAANDGAANDGAADGGAVDGGAVDSRAMPSDKAEELTDDLESRLTALLDSKPTPDDLYDAHSLQLAAYALEHKPAAYEALRSIVRANRMDMRRYEQEVRKHIKAPASDDPELPPFVRVSRKTGEYIDCPALADYTRQHLNYILVQDNLLDTLSKYVYEHGVYVQCSEDRFRGHIKRFITDYKPSLLRMRDVDEVVRQLNTDLTAIPATCLNRDENIINFQNGLLRLDTMELRPHDPAMLSSIQIPCDWGEALPTPIFDRYLDTLTDDKPAIRELLLEFIGVVISNVQGWRMKKALFMYGEGDTGKSQLKTLVERLLGEENFIGIDLSDIEARFGTSAIYRKRLAGSSDMSFLTIRELKTFKRCTGGDTQFAEYKGKNAFSFIFGGLLWFCMNRLPKFGGDDGRWVYDRIIAIECKNIIPLEVQDKEIVDKMYAEREGIVHKAVMALRTVLANGYRYSEPFEVEVARTEYRAENNSVIQFIQECMEPREVPGQIGKYDADTVTSVIRIYRKWCVQNSNGYAKTKKEFKETYADYFNIPLEDAIVRRGQGSYFAHYRVTQEAYANLLPSDADVHRDLVLNSTVL